MRFPSISAAALPALLLKIPCLQAAEERDFAPFEFLLQRSPFSLPTAEETSPLAERYCLTGAVEWGGKQQVFILDKATQQRHVVSPEGGTAGMVLLEFLPHPDPRRMQARVQIGGQVATISYAEAAAAENAAAPMPADQPHQIAQQAAQLTPGSPPPPRRVIRRRVIAATPEAAGGHQPSAPPP